MKMTALIASGHSVNLLTQQRLPGYRFKTEAPESVTIGDIVFLILLTLSS